jgi:hypothetical protein
LDASTRFALRLKNEAKDYVNLNAVVEAISALKSFPMVVWLLRPSSNKRHGAASPPCGRGGKVHVSVTLAIRNSGYLMLQIILKIL